MTGYIKYLIEKKVIYKTSSGRPMGKNQITKGEEIAKKLNVRLDGYYNQIRKFAFTDIKKTKSSFIAGTYEEAKEKLEDMQEKFKEQPSKSSLETA
jgi:hypothetical protein